MPKTKAKTDAKDKTASAPTVQKQPETPEKLGGPQRAAPTTSSALPPPNGTPPAGRAADVMTAPEQGAGAAGRARMMRGMQQSVGNARISRLVRPTVQTKLTVGAPNDRYEQEADRTAETVMRAEERATPDRSTREIQAKVAEGGARHDEGETSSDLQRQLNASKGNGRPLSPDTRTSLEPALGADLSNVKVHTGSDAVQMNRELGAQAFTHGSDIYFDEGKYDPESSSGKRLLAHELTHTVQQGGSAVRPKRSTEERYTTTDAPDIQAAWYNIDIPFTDYQFDPSIEGVKTAAGIAKDTVVESASWVKDQAVAAFEWVYDKIEGLITAGSDWLREKFSEIEEFATSAFDRVKDGLAALLGYITAPVRMIRSAFESMNADLLGVAWSALTSGARLVWTGIKAVVDGVFEVGTGLWNTVSGYVSSLFDRVSSLIDSWPFRQLPDFLQRKARELFAEVRAVWERIKRFITDTLERLRAFTDGILQSVESFVQKVLDYAIDTVIETIRTIRETWEFVKQVAADPEGFVRPVVDQIAAKVYAEGPPKARELAREKVQQTYQGNGSPSPAAGVIQRQADTRKPERSTASSAEATEGILDALGTAWDSLDIRTMLWNTIVNMFWPPATIKAIGHEFSEMWTKDWANTVDSLFVPRNILEEPAGFFHDIWSNILILLEFPLALWRRLNSVVMLLLGYVTIILVIVGAVGGAIAGGGALSIPGAIAGATAGLELAGAIGVAFLYSFFGAEMISVIKWIVQLRTARQTQAEKDRAYVQIAGSLIGMGVAAVLVAILWLLSQFVAAVVRTVKARGAKGEVEVEPPTEEVKPPKEEGKPPTEEVEPPTEEAKPPEEKSKIPAVGRKVPLDKVRYSQKSVSRRTRDGRTIDEVAGDMRENGWDESKPSPDMVDWGDGGYQTLDHRRLVAAKRAGIKEVPANVHPAGEPLPPEQAARFTFQKTFTDPVTGKTYEAGNLPENWGEAAMGRSAKQGKSFPLRGSPEQPRVSGE